jgi:hypothetical protein
MRTTASAALCDAVEVGVLQLRSGLSIDNIVEQAMLGFPKDEARSLAEDALGVAQLRAEVSPEGYPFEANEDYIRTREVKEFDAYCFLLLGFDLRRSCIPDVGSLVRRFERVFEDMVCWSLRMAGFTSCVLSEPREEHGLPRALVPALAYVAELIGEAASLGKDRLKKDDNDLDVDVVAAPIVVDPKRRGRPTFFMQCTTSRAERLWTKKTEGYNLFCSVWENGFWGESSVRGGATPEDLLTLDPRDWDRLSQNGWVLDRMRLVELTRIGIQSGPRVPQEILSLWGDLLTVLPDFDWRNAWQAGLFARGR